MADSTKPTPALVGAVREVAQLGGEVALRYFRNGVAVEGKRSAMAFDPVTEGDREAERQMRRFIEAKYPEHGILGEEHGEKRSDSPWRWVLDPIDGTRGFMSGTPTWTTLVGLEHEGVPVAGAIVQPFTGETWHGFPGGATYHGPGGSSPCRSSACTELESARLAATDPRPLPQGYMTAEEAEAFSRVGAKCPVARFGCDAYAYGLLALGQIDLVVESGLQRYDVAALFPVLAGAGAKMAGWTGEASFDGGRIVAAATPELFEAAQTALGRLQ